MLLNLELVILCIETSNNAVVLMVHKDYLTICEEVRACGLFCVIFFELLVNICFLTWNLSTKGLYFTFLMSGNTSPCYFIPSWSGTSIDPLLGAWGGLLSINYISYIPLANAFPTHIQVYICVEDVSFSAFVAMTDSTFYSVNEYMKFENHRYNFQLHLFIPFSSWLEWVL